VLLQKLKGAQNDQGIHFYLFGIAYSLGFIYSLWCSNQIECVCSSSVNINNSLLPGGSLLKRLRTTYRPHLFLFYDASAEVQTYLTILRREKKALELLIREIVVGGLLVRSIFFYN
jgi:hypothetical protein